MMRETGLIDAEVISSPATPLMAGHSLNKVQSLFDLRRDPKGSLAKDAINSVEALSLRAAQDLNQAISRRVGHLYERLFFGLKITEALRTGYAITHRNYFEATESPAAIHTALLLQKLWSSRGLRRQGKVLDPFAGTGQMAWAFNAIGAKIFSFELNEINAAAANRNLRLASRDLHTQVICENGLRFMYEATERGQEFDCIYLDPPWAGHYQYDLARPFDLRFTAPASDELVTEALRISSIAAVKCPQSISIEQIKALGRALGTRVLVAYQDILGFHPSLNQATVFFIKDRRFSLSVCRYTIPQDLDVRGGLERIPVKWEAR